MPSMPPTNRTVGPWLDRVLSVSGFAVFAGLVLLSASWFQVLQVPIAVGVSVTLAGAAGLVFWFVSLLRARNQALREFGKIQGQVEAVIRQSRARVNEHRQVGS